MSWPAAIERHSAVCEAGRGRLTLVVEREAEVIEREAE